MQHIRASYLTMGFLWCGMVPSNKVSALRISLASKNPDMTSAELSYYQTLFWHVFSHAGSQGYLQENCAFIEHTGYNSSLLC